MCPGIYSVLNFFSSNTKNRLLLEAVYAGAENSLVIYFKYDFFSCIFAPFASTWRGEM